MHQDQASPTAKPARRKTADPFAAAYQRHYDLTEFIAKYRLTPLEAREIFERIGPARRTLDTYMAQHGSGPKAD